MCVLLSVEGLEVACLTLQSPPRPPLFCILMLYLHIVHHNYSLCGIIGENIFKRNGKLRKMCIRLGTVGSMHEGEERNNAMDHISRLQVSLDCVISHMHESDADPM